MVVVIIVINRLVQFFSFFGRFTNLMPIISSDVHEPVQLEPELGLEHILFVEG
jgi:hypothetical protein